jgi:hypothetical protein
MWNNYTVDMLNPGKIEARQAEAEAERRAAEGRERGEHTSRATALVERVAAFGTSHLAAARDRAGVAVTGLRHLHGPRHAAGQHRA